MSSRRRWIYSHEAPVWCPGGRWGPRRVRVNECWSVFHAEDVYTRLLTKDASNLGPGARGTSTWLLERRKFTAAWEVRPNTVWRRGRVFLLCPRCGRRCTRLYLPLATSWLACRTCWGLTYDSRTMQNYKNSLWGRGAIARMFATTQRDWALLTTFETRQARRRRCADRWAERRKYLQSC
jgi:hypothetical protein